MANTGPIAIEYDMDGMAIDPNMAANAKFAADFEMPKIDLMGKVEGFGNKEFGLAGAKPDTGFTLGSVGSTMQGIGAIASAAAGMYDAHNKKKYQDKIFGMEEQRVARATARQDKQQAAYDKVFG